MLRWVVRAGLIRFVGRKAIPVLIVYDAVQLVRTVRRRTRKSDQAPDRHPPESAR
jgi:hypothetical protein